jgi:hypothetical protein
MQQQLKWMKTTTGVAVLGMVSPKIIMAAEEITSVNLDISIDYSNDPFYAEIWFWGGVALFFLILLVLLIRGGGRKKKAEKQLKAEIAKAAELVEKMEEEREP